MTPAPTITLFSEQADLSTRPATLAASALIHAGVIALVSFGVLYAPRVEVRSNEHMTLRHLDLREPEEAMRRAALGIEYPGRQVRVKNGAPGKAAPRAPSLLEAAHAPIGPQTLLQPNIKHVEVTEQIPVPQVLIWTPSKSIVKNIVAPLPEAATSSQAKPSPDPPNQEINVSDIGIASSAVANQKLKIMAATTSPVALRGNDLLQLPPSTVSQVAAQPTPAAVMSLSNLRMQGTAVLPPVNESARADASGMLAPSPTKSGSAQGTGATKGNASGAGAGQGADTANSGAKPAGPEGRPAGAKNGLSQGSDSGAGQSASSSATEITLPKSGVFGAVVVGDSLQEQYPELAGIWNGRMAYTVYLHVGLSRSWILQYSLPADTAVTLNGGTDRLEPPWPYSIVRPNLAAGAINADALMVHGFVNASGHFEGLSVVFPTDFPQGQFVLSSLERWQFRPATQNGQIARVEVLLIIPEELD